MKKARTTEKSVEQEIRTLLTLHGWRVHKTDVLRGVRIEYTKKNGSKSFRRFSEGEKGDPDLIAVRPTMQFPSQLCQVVYIETKAPDGVPSKYQWLKHEYLRKLGFIVLIPTSWSDLLEQAGNVGLRVERD